MTSLPDAAWRGDPALRAVLAALGDDPATTRAVGGAVRDTLAGLPVSDVDLATRLRPDDVIARLGAAGLKAVPTGIAHGTITAVAGGRPFEVTTLRRDVATDGRRATVAFSDDWAEDAARRDFTINALYADPLSGEMFDPVGGIADLAARRVLFIGDAAARIDEDHLRIMRWFRFLARFGSGAPDAATLAVVAGRAAKLRGLSRERIADELLRILALPDPAATLSLMEQAGVLAQIAPEALPGGVTRLAALVARENASALPGDPVLRLIALLPEEAGMADSVAARLKLANRTRKRLLVARGGAPDPEARAQAYRIGAQGARDRLLLGVGDPAAGLAALADWTPPRLPIGGGDLVALGLNAGPEVARLLAEVTNRWLDEGFPDRERTMAIASGLLR
jgi:poly(A) polymerase